MIEKGDIDVAYGMTVADINALKDNKDISVEAIKKGTLYYVAVSMRDPKYANIKVRQAIRLLIDYEGINKTIMPNYGFFHQRPIQAGLPATLPDQGYKLDVAAAKKLLAEAGYPNGFKTVIHVLSTSLYQYRDEPSGYPGSGRDPGGSHLRYRKPGVWPHEG